MRQVQAASVVDLLSSPPFTRTGDERRGSEGGSERGSERRSSVAYSVLRSLYVDVWSQRVHVMEEGRTAETDTYRVRIVRPDILMQDSRSPLY